MVETALIESRYKDKKFFIEESDVEPLWHFEVYSGGQVCIGLRSIAKFPVQANSLIFKTHLGLLKVGNVGGMQAEWSGILTLES